MSNVSSMATPKERHEVNPFVLKLGIALALSLAGYLFSHFRVRIHLKPAGLFFRDLYMLLLCVIQRFSILLIFWLRWFLTLIQVNLILRGVMEVLRMNFELCSRRQPQSEKKYALSIILLDSLLQ